MPTIPYAKTTHSDGQSWSAAKANQLEDGITNVSYAPTVRVTHNADQSITTATWTALAFNTEDWDKAGNAADTQHDNAINNSRLIAKYAGVYQVSASITWQASATGHRFIALVKGAGPTPAQGDPVDARPGHGTAAYNRMSIPGQFDLAVNEFVTLCVFQDSGAGLNVLGTATATRPAFGMVRVA